MALTNYDRVGKSMELLKSGLSPFVENEMKAVHGDNWKDIARQGLEVKKLHWDVQAILSVMWNNWNSVFNKTLGHTERSIVSELRDVRNRWAHQEPFSTDDAYRAIDSIHRLLTAVAAPDEAISAEHQKQELLRIRYEEQARKEVKKVAATAIETGASAGFKPWREIATPHEDVARGKYQQAEFAADLSQVYRGEGSPEYKDPAEFYRRTFLTEGLHNLLADALARLSGNGGNPVINLQTNFGGGKTHSMLALYHLFSGVKSNDLLEVDKIMRSVEVTTLPKVKRAVLVGTALSPAQTRKKDDGTVVHTLWGELAWQLLGKEGYKLVADADKHGISPGSDILRDIFSKAAPCLILIDEWVAYIRLLYGKSDIPGGTFDASLTFAQSLTEAVRAVSKAMLVASLPSSNIEIGGEGGREALDKLKNTFGRVEASWRPATAEESFEIVRRRLFEPIKDFKARDAVIRAYSEMYRTQSQEFPSNCREGEYERRMQSAYPIHPELFDRLYNDWSSLETFQRTRGVLRLMAAVIHVLLERNDASLLIMPANIPIDAPNVRSELLRYLEDPWAPVIESDVDGPHSLPLQMDRDNPNLGRYSACRRVSRTIYIGSAPTLTSANRGIEDRLIKLGCAQPGETVATFGDALRKLAERATHLYVDGKRYWYSTQPTVTRLAQDRASQQSFDKVFEEIMQRLREEQSYRGEFAKVHICPDSDSDIPDDKEARLVILKPELTYFSNGKDSPALIEAKKILEQRGSSPRRYRNSLVFIAADKALFEDLGQSVRDYLAWQSIEAEREALNLDVFQSNQTKTKRQQANETVEHRIQETYRWLLIPSQADPHKAIEWKQIKLQSQDHLAVKASKKLVNDGLLINNFSGLGLRLELDKIPLWRGDHVSLRQLSDDFAQYLYLSRFRDEGVLIRAIENGVSQTSWTQDGFAYADKWDESAKRYRGLTHGRLISVVMDADSVLVKPDIALKQIEETQPDAGRIPGTERPATTPTSGELPDESPKEPTLPKRFYGVVSLDGVRVGRDAGRIAEEVIQHLSSIPGAAVDITMEINAKVPSGIAEDKVRTILENCRTLKFKTQGFEEE